MAWDAKEHLKEEQFFRLIRPALDDPGACEFKEHLRECKECAGQYEVEKVLRKPGRDWTSSEMEKVANWLETRKLKDLVRFAFGFTKDRAQAEDIVRDKIKDLLRFLPGYNPEKYRGKKCPFRNYLFTIVARACARRRGKKERPLKGRRGTNTPGTERGHAEVSEEDPLAGLEPYVQRLPPRDQEILELRYKLGKSLKEIAGRLHCSVGAAKVRLFRARHRLRRLLKEKGFFDRIAHEP